MTHVFVSGCFDILHAGHVQFFREAHALGDQLTVCFASGNVLWAHQRRRSSLPDEHKHAILSSLSMVDRVVIGQDARLGLPFEEHFLRLRPDLLIVTTDDQYGDLKRELCDRVGAKYHVLEKTRHDVTRGSTTELVNLIRAPVMAPLRVDFGGGWLDVPRFARPGAFIVNCAISPLVSLRAWPYRAKSGLGGSAAYAMLRGDDGVRSELDLGVGWQDPAVIAETGLCVWRSGPQPRLQLKRDGKMLRGRMALLWTGNPHDTPGAVDLPRAYETIQRAGELAAKAVLQENLQLLAAGVRYTYATQVDEGMHTLPDVPQALAKKYCGGGWGGYAVYIFSSDTDRDNFVREFDGLPIEPYLRHELLALHVESAVGAETGAPFRRISCNT